ncbi:histone deacetylase [Luteolibacter arcticus]|uniref:Histone deacetylase n=1 Tax=Luteolibacter arcticus TaxID=1581411 RepID=A0ABT3GIE9_9BACT|nr:histone deacetylase [Luteolibacter arcticus]MCW1923298.1 histone deacetylase [Luteolibacter arcticus]
MKPIGVHYDPCYERHDTGPGHPESAARYRVLREALEKLPRGIVRLPGRKATVAEVLFAHEPHYHDLVYRDVISCADMLRTGDTALCEDSYDVALEATGAVIEAVNAVMSGEVARAFCAVRPPGHHATAERGMGFCIFNHVAIAANHLRRVHGLQRIAIVDWDVHHGNGTEAIFEADPGVFYVSLHEANIYPYTGHAAHRGSGAGEGFTLNLPLPHGSDGSVALAAWDEHAAPALEAFRPEFVLVSAGFDARDGDPLGGLRWDDETFAGFTRRVVSIADKHAEGRVVSSLEGGYYPPGLASAAVAHVEALR